jgi:hypothetical protein
MRLKTGWKREKQGLPRVKNNTFAKRWTKRSGTSKMVAGQMEKAVG